MFGIKNARRTARQDELVVCSDVLQTLTRRPPCGLHDRNLTLGDDMVNLPWLSVGAAGFVSVVGHVAGDRLHEMIDAYSAGRVAEALRIHRELLPVYTGIFRTQGVILTKAALGLLGRPGGPVRLPLPDATPAEVEQLREDLTAGGVKIR